MQDQWIKDLQEAHQRLVKAFEKVPNEGKISGEWTKKELMAHIAGWYEEFDKEVGAVGKILQGEKPISFRMSINGYNQRSVDRRKNETQTEILSEMKILHQQFIKLIKKIDEKQITGYYGTMLREKPINVLWIINEAISHDNEHAKELENLFQ